MLKFPHEILNERIFDSILLFIKNMLDSHSQNFPHFFLDSHTSQHFQHAPNKLGLIMTIINISKIVEKIFDDTTAANLKIICNNFTRTLNIIVRSDESEYSLKVGLLHGE